MAAATISSAHAQTAPVVSAADSAMVRDSLLMDSLVGPPPAPAADTIRSRFVPPDRWRASERANSDRLLAGPSWPMPPPHEVAGGDLADWLSYHPAYDVDDAPGLGQTRFFTHWGTVKREGGWTVDGRTLGWQRLTFPMTAQFDPAILPSFGFESYRFGESAILTRDSSWGERPVFDYTYRQGDYSDSYSEGSFRGRTKGGFGMALNGTFLSSDGRYYQDDRDQRILGFGVFGPLAGDLLWRARYTQFRDQSLILTPEPFDLIHPERDDLLWTGEVALARLVDSVPRWQLGARVQSGQQRLRDPLYYAVNTDDRTWELFGESRLANWDFTAVAALEELTIDSTDADRWRFNADAARTWTLSDVWSAALQVSGSDYETDPLSLSAVATLSPQNPLGLNPTIRLARERRAPTLFDRSRPLVVYTFINAVQEGFLYSEQGDPLLEDQWNNEIGLHWGAEDFADSARFGWSIAGHAAYIENYTVWEGREVVDTLTGSLPVDHHQYRPRGADARSLGAAIGLHGRLFWRIHYLTHYAVKYATDLNDRKLSGYYPHKGVAMVSLIAPRWFYGVDVRLNAAGLWWYNDTRIDPTGYGSSHVFRVDLSGSASVVRGLAIYAQMQNVAGFPYRTRAGYPFTARTLRFGIHATLFD